MNKVKQKDLILYSGLIILGLAAPYLFSAFKVQLTYLCVLIVLAMTWNLQGGEMGYNSFGNILFYGLGMYLTASVQVGMFFLHRFLSILLMEKTYQLELRQSDTFQDHRKEYFQKNYSPFLRLVGSKSLPILSKHTELLAEL